MDVKLEYFRRTLSRLLQAYKDLSATTDHSYDISYDHAANDAIDLLNDEIVFADGEKIRIALRLAKLTKKGAYLSDHPKHEDFLELIEEYKNVQ